VLGLLIRLSSVFDLIIAIREKIEKVDPPLDVRKKEIIMTGKECFEFD
jgi:hypothetical protein